MKSNILITVLTLFLSVGITGCEDDKADTNSKYPECMQERIDLYIRNNLKPLSSPARIDKYLYNGKIVYIFDIPNVPDLGFTVVGENCNVICGGGGFTGKNDCEYELEYVETVWKDNR